MFTKSLLINYAGFPNEPRLLVPDNGLANLAAALIQKGHSTTILDYATVDMIEKLFPYEYKEQLDDITKRIMVNQKQGLSPNQKDLDEFHGLDEKIENLQRKKVQEIATEISSIVRKKNIDFVGFKLWMGDGFEGSIMIAEQLKKDYPRLPIFAGGPHVDWFREKIFDVCDAFDAIAYGDGEEVITMLADYVSDKIKLEDIPNLIYRKNNGFVTTQKKLVEDLNNLPLPINNNVGIISEYGSMGGFMRLVSTNSSLVSTVEFFTHRQLPTSAIYLILVLSIIFLIVILFKEKSLIVLS